MLWGLEQTSCISGPESFVSALVLLVEELTASLQQAYPSERIRNTHL